MAGLIVLAGTTSAIIYQYILGTYLGGGYPAGSFLFVPTDRFMDFYNDYRYAARYGKDSSVIVYTPLAHIVMRAVNAVPSDVAFALAMSVFVATVVVALMVFALRRVEQPALVAQYLVVFTALSYPFLLVVDRGNMDGLVFGVLFWALFSYRQGRTTIAAVLLGLAAALKIYPAVFLVLPLSDRRYREAEVASAVALGATALATAAVALESGRAYLGVLSDTAHTLIGGHGEYAMTGPAPIQFGHSLWGVYHYMVLSQTGRDPGALASRVYSAAALAVFGLLSAWLLSAPGRAAALWRKVALLTAAALLLPSVSHDYRLILVYLPLMLLLADAGRDGYRIAVAACLATLMIPVNYAYLRGEVSISILVYPVVLLALLALVVTGPWGGVSRRGGDA